MIERACSFANDYSEIPRLTLALSLADDVLNAANRLLIQKGISFRMSFVAPDDEDPEQTISVEMKRSRVVPRCY